MGDYEDIEVVDYLNFGWPISHTENTGSKHPVKNWGGATNHMTKVKEYMAVEVEKESVLGPKKKESFWGGGVLLAGFESEEIRFRREESHFRFVTSKREQRK